MRDLPEAEPPEIDPDMLEFFERRREEHARARRQRIQLVAIIALSVIAVVLAISNAVLVNRLLARPTTSPTGNAPAVRESSPSAPAAPEPEPPPAAASEPSPPATRTPAPSPRVSSSAPRRDTSAPPETPLPENPAVREPVPSQTPAADQSPSIAAEPPALPQRAAPGSRTPAVPDGARSGNARERLAEVESDPALRTARWMVQTYGRLEAESKALAATQFYTGSERAFWRRVVSHVRAER